MRAIADEVAAGRLKPSAVSEKTIQKHLYTPELPDVDLFVRSGRAAHEQLHALAESAYAEMVFLDTLWPDFSRTDLWQRDRPLRGAQPPVRRRRRRADRLSEHTRVSPHAARDVPVSSQVLAAHTLRIALTTSSSLAPSRRA